MKWNIAFTKQAEKDIKKLPKADQERILKFLYNKVLPHKNPLELAKRLSGNFSDFFRFRVGEFRIIFKAENTTLTILVLKIGHRKEIYREH